VLACPLFVGYLTGEINIGNLSHYSGPIIAESAIALWNNCVVQNRDCRMITVHSFIDVYWSNLRCISLCTFILLV